MIFKIILLIIIIKKVSVNIKITGTQKLVTIYVVFNAGLKCIH